MREGREGGLEEGRKEGGCGEGHKEDQIIQSSL